MSTVSEYAFVFLHKRGLRAGVRDQHWSVRD